MSPNGLKIALEVSLTILTTTASGGTPIWPLRRRGNLQDAIFVKIPMLPNGLKIALEVPMTILTTTASGGTSIWPLRRRGNLQGAIFVKMPMLPNGLKIALEVPLTFLDSKTPRFGRSDAAVTFRMRFFCANSSGPRGWRGEREGG